MTINGQQTSATEFAFDGCHKIYMLDNPEDRDMMIDYSYDIYSVSELQGTWERSCGLKFISSADLTRSYVEQCEQAVITEYETI